MLDGRLLRRRCGWWTPGLHCAWWRPAERSAVLEAQLVLLCCVHGSNELCMNGVARMCTRYSFWSAEFDNVSEVAAICVVCGVFTPAARQELVVEACRRAEPAAAATGGVLLVATCFIGP